MGSFTIRVYGICILNGKVLLTDEFIHGMNVTKFPGGGLEWGEGTRDCLKREMMEETAEEVEVLDHVYTTDIFLQSAFDSSKQVMSIYYNFRFLNTPKFMVKQKPFDFDEIIPDAQIFRWVDIKTLSQDQLTLPVDKMMVDFIQKEAF
jgi:8-oxo-dGTP diphosphatase